MWQPKALIQNAPGTRGNHFPRLGSKDIQTCKVWAKEEPALLPRSSSLLNRLLTLCDEQLRLRAAGTIRGHVWVRGECTVPSSKAVTLGFRIRLRRNALTHRSTPSVYCRVLIGNLRSALEAQFDSGARATGHSYEKYNNWETVGCARGLDRHLGIEPRTSH